jgi:predicted Zn-dependent protease
MKTRFALLATVGMLGVLACALPATAADQEQQIGQQVYAQLQQKGEIISTSPLYSVLNPIADRIKTVADPQYQYPFHFILVHESSPNAFAVPGGNVYVTDSLMHFVKYKEELAGVLCHETSHDIHHDVVNLMQKNATQGAIIGILGAITGIDRSGLGQFGENIAYTLQSNRFSRGVETAADLKGSNTCAQAGYNPNGMIWLFNAFEKSGTGGGAEFLSDHPRDDHRISDLERHFASNPDLFGKYAKDDSHGTPFKLPAAGAQAIGPSGATPRPNGT